METEEITSVVNNITTYLPYLATVICAVISGFASYFAARRQSKADLKQLERTHELDIEKEREMFAMEKERLEIEHRHQLELKQKEIENQMGADLIKSNAYARSSSSDDELSW